MPSLALIVPSTTLVVPLPVNRFPNKLVPTGHNSTPRNPPFCSFALLLFVWLTSFIKKPDSSSHLTILIISFISSFGIINVVTPDPNIFLWIAACHRVKSVQIQSFFWSVFSRTRVEYGDLRNKSPYSAQIREDTDQKKLRIWAHFTKCLLLMLLLLIVMELKPF